MVKGFFKNLKNFWRYRRNFGGAGKKTPQTLQLVKNN